MNICVLLGCNFTHPYVRGWYVDGNFWDWRLNVIKSTKWSEWNVVFCWNLFTFVCTHIDVLFLCLWPNKCNQINEMKWIFAYFLGWNFACPYVHVYQINEMIWNNLCFFLLESFHICMYVYRCSFSLFMI